MQIPRFFSNSDGCVCAANDNVACDEKNADYCDPRWVFSSKLMSILKFYKHVKQTIFP